MLLHPAGILLLHARDDQLDIIVAKLERGGWRRRKPLAGMQRLLRLLRRGEEALAEEDDEEAEEQTHGEQVCPLATPDDHDVLAPRWWDWMSGSSWRLGRVMRQL